MKQKKERTALKNRIAVSALLIGLFGLGVSIYYSIIHQEDKLELFANPHYSNYYTGLIFSLISFGIVVLFWEELEKLTTGDLPDEIAQDLINRASRTDFQVIKKEDAYRIAADEILHAHTIRIVGSARTIAQGRAIQFTKNYLENTIKRLEEDPHVTYRRICSCDLDKVFQEHLRKCMQTNSQDFNLILLTEFQPPHTWLIIDDRIYMLILNHHETTEELCYITRDKTVIAKLEHHFNDLWSAHKDKGIIKSLKDYEDVIAKNSKVRMALNVINTEYIKNTDLGRITDYIESSYNELKKHLENISARIVEIDHANSTASLLKAFSMYINKMEVGDRYYVITTIGVWKKVKHEDEREHAFDAANVLALSKGVEMNRILILDSNIINIRTKTVPKTKKQAEFLYKYYLTMEIIRGHIIWLKTYPNYDFKILFTPDYEEHTATMNNFTLINYEDGENVLFLPQTENGHITKTMIKFKASSEATNKRETFDKKIESLMKQFVDQKHIDFLKEIDPAFFSDNKNLIKVIGSDKARKQLL